MSLPLFSDKVIPTHKELKEISTIFSAANLVNNRGFDESLNVARQILENEEWDQELQEYAVDLLEEIRKQFSEKWNSNWRYDAFLGYAYNIIFKYDERYAAYKRAFNRISPPPPQLLTALAECCWAPGSPPITEQEAILLVKEAMKEVPYIEAAQLIRGLYKSIGDTNQQVYWERILEKIKDNGIHLSSLSDF